MPHVWRDKELEREWNKGLTPEEIALNRQRAKPMLMFRAMCAGSVDLANGLEKVTSRLTPEQCDAWADTLIAKGKIDS